MSGTNITDAVLSGGQNEGIERSVLPLPNLAYVQNARQRKAGRWGKRYGTAALPSTNVSGVTLGNGTGNARTIGNGFVVIDDQCAVFARASGAWADPRLLCPPNTTSPACANPRVPGAVSGWLPDNSFWPVPSISRQSQQLTPCAQVYAQGYLWTAIQFIDPSNVFDSIIRVVATDATDQTVFLVQDFIAGTAAQGGNIYPKLLACGNTVILTYVSRPLNAAAFVAARRFTGGTAFGAETSVVAYGAPGNVYDASGFSSTKFLLAVATTAFFVDSTSLATGASQAGPAIAPVGLSIIGATGTPVYMVTSSAGATRVSVFNTTLTATVGTVIVDAAEPATYTAYAALLPGGGVRVSYGYFTDAGAVPRHFSWRDVTAAATLVSGLIGRQYRFQPISRPFTVGTQVYQWVTNPDAASGFGYATLLRLPALSEYPTLTGTTNYLSCPIEMSPNDFLIRSTKPTIFIVGSSSIWLAGLAEQANGLPAVAQIGTSASYAFVAPTLPGVPDPEVPFFSDYRVIQASHYTDIASARSVVPAVVDGCTILPGAALTRIDQRGAVESGFVLRPAIFPPITKSGAGGLLSPSVTYQYTAVYKSSSENGQIELSAPADPASIVMGPGDSETFVPFLLEQVSARASVQMEVYRTLGNGTIFYLVDTIDGGAATGQSITYNDQLSDVVISKHQVLYTQVGQTLPNTFPPPCSIATAGGNRVFLGGLLRPDVIHCSKLIEGDQSPSWADSDSFRIVMPAPVMGIAWMDNLLVFTTEGVYSVSGDGPDDSGNGEFSNPVRLPFTLGCIEPRSVVTVDEGTFFQTSRGLYMVPRGFGSPIPAGDTVLDALAQYPVITGVAALIKTKEQTVRWSCMETVFFSGQQIVYDLVHKCWSIDAVTDPPFTSNFTGLVSIGGWLGGETAMATSGGTFMASNSTFADSGHPIAMQLRTGDIRPFGNMSEGVLSKVNLMGELRALCTLNTTKATEWGTSPASPRVFAAAAGDAQPGQITYVETELGNTELRDAASLNIQWDESSTTEAFAFIAIAIEHEQSEGLKRVSALARGT